MKPSEFDNRRQYPRKRLEGCEVQLKPIDASLGEMAVCSYGSLSRDISDGGMRIWTDQFYSINTRLLVSFENNAQAEWASVTTRVGVVMWVSPDSREGYYLIGIKFGDEDEIDDAPPW
ncbi:PilZ domain-containing protein [Chromatium okenii]|uniref:PilZ domain-containing protein n=1 Tax=Chromatium okenii TaxID=61644 RepID=UPI0026F11ED9|nr:PilZ domain-containing protein [Chromatium okenii]MBV5308191.1 PilZ domain-containing protein [Chromatium okenii]